LWAVHIGDGMLTPTWCAGGFVVAGLLALWGAWRIREEEIPQLAVLTAVFFLTALIHVPIPGGPKTHLLLNGLLGVVLGRRAILAVLVGLFLQSSLSVMEGVGFSTLGVNACVMALPAYLAWGLFAGLQRLPWIRHPILRGGLVAFCTTLAVLSMVYAVTALVSNYPPNIHTLDLSRANAWTLNPLTIAATLLLAGGAVWVERHLEHAAEFPVGLLIGELAVLLTIFLNGLVLLLGGTSDWTGVVLLTYVLHLPLAVVEGIILGFTVGFLARVKPQLLYGYRPPQPIIVSSTAVSPAPSTAISPEPSTAIAPASSTAISPTPIKEILALFLAPLLLLAGARPAFAHRLEAEHKILPDKRIVIESWFDLTGDAAHGAKVRVTRPDGSVVAEGEIDAKGLFVFPFEKAETLKVVVNAGMGHAKELQIPESELSNAGAANTEPQAPTPAPPPEPTADRSSKFQFRDILIALAFIFGLAAFVLSLRHGRVLREMKREQEKRHASEPPLANGANSPNHHIRPPLS
jgi:cobalt/nickel transport system permease protein